MQIAGRYGGYQRKIGTKAWKLTGITGWVGIEGHRIRDDMTKGMDGKLGKQGRQTIHK